MCKLPAPGTTHRKPANADQVVVDSILRFHVFHCFENINFTGKFEGIAIASVGVKDDRVLRGVIPDDLRLLVNKISFAKCLASTMKPNI